MGSFECMTQEKFISIFILCKAGRLVIISLTSKCHLSDAILSVCF